MNNIVLCDIDGTIANNSHRQHFLHNQKDWDGFFSELINDEPIFPLIEKILELQLEGKQITFLTGRPERYSYSTNLWLKEYFKFDYEIIMRKDNDKRNKVEVKKELFNLNFTKDDIFCVYDNDYDLLKMWKDIGLVVIDANSYFI
tara:strand:- start:115 stop:549 length:435 start_codon:yes stop_codon:yes gene_type:complete